MGPHEPYWRTNTSFSPPPPRWDFRFHSEVESFDSQEGNRLYGSSTSSNSRESRNWLRTNYLPNHRHSNSDGIGAFFGTPSDLSPAQQWTPPAIQEISLHERVLVPLSFSPTSEVLSVPHENRASISSNSDSSDFAGRGCFMSKPVHPVNSGIHDSDDRHRSSCEFEFSDVSEPIESDSLDRLSGGFDKCGFCERFLSQRSPWSSRQIIRSGDFPVTGVLSCRHVYHVECLDQTTPKTHKGDPPCPICSKSESKKDSPEQRVLSKLKNGVPCNAMLLINQNRIKKGVLMKGSSGKEFAGKLKGFSQWGGGGGGDGVGSSKSASSSRKKL
ncbi:unnamed protein product [Lactuca saligna]|uniref:RING-type domain-containing protein n=1 Tax=Lactuca saligna TaxID=75948 RepID=A0AA35YKZ3_LACSI|nr:unnamed protein product [Lactuca saligna]